MLYFHDFHFYSAKPSDYLEVFITMGVIDFSLYVGDDDSPEVKLLKPPPSQGVFKMSTEPRVKVNPIVFIPSSPLLLISLHDSMLFVH